MKYKLVESKNKENITHAVDDDFTFSIFDVDEVKTSNLNESVEKNATIEEDYNYSEYDKKLLVNRAKSIAQEIYKLYNRADVEEQGELPSAKEIAEDLLSNPKKVDMYARFLSKMKGSKTANRFVEKLINELASFKKKLVAMKPQTESLKKMLTEDISMGLFSFDFSCAYPDDVWKIYDDLCDEFGCDHVGYPEDIDYSEVGSGYETEYPNVFQSSVAFPHEDNDASDVAIISDRVRNIISKYVAEVEGTDLSTLGESFERSRRTSLNEAEVPIRLSMDDMTNSDNFNLGNKVKKEVADENQRIADEKERQRIATLREENKKTFDIIGGSSSVEDKVEALFNTFVPSRGKSDVVIGELARALMRLRYRKWNDGDLYFIGYGIETCCNAYNYIMYNMSEWDEDTFNKLSKLSSAIEKEARKFCKENEYQVLSKGWGWEELDEKYDKFLDDFSQVVLDWMYNNPDKCFAEADDMLSSEYSDETDLRDSEPRVSIEFSSGNASWELFNYVEEYGDTIGYSEYDLVRDFSDDADQWDNAEEESSYSDCVVYSVPMSEAKNFNDKMLDWCDAKLEELISEYGEDPEGDEEEEEDEDEEDIDESMNETFFGKGDKQKGGPVALDPEEDTEELRKKVKKIAKQAAENAKKADKQTKKKNCTDCEE